MILRSGKDAQTKFYCPSCGSAWANLCPYCSAPLEKPTVCTKGSDRCIFEGPPIVLCESCSCPVTPDTTKCPRCFKDLVECQECKKEGKEKRMIPRGSVCIEKHVKAEPKAEAKQAEPAMQAQAKQPEASAEPKASESKSEPQAESSESKSSETEAEVEPAPISS